MNRNDLITVANANAGTLADVTYIEKGEDGKPFETTLRMVIEGKVNSKGLVVRLHADEPSFTIAPTRVVAVTPVVIKDSDGMTSAEVAAIFDMSAKELRVITRKMGLGVGKGKRYTFVPADVDAIRAHLADA